MKCVLKYPGAKNRLASWICSYIPPHQVYLEPYFGSGAVFFNKEPAKIETINDLHGEEVNYFKVIRDKPEQLVSLLQRTPYARDEYESSFSIKEVASDVERARKFAVRCWQGFGSSNLYKNGFRTSQQKGSPHTTKEWRELPERLLAASERLKNAQIENVPALELINRYNTEDVFIYVDPPYLLNTRKRNLYYYELSNDEHMQLLSLLKSHKGKILVSGYDNELYNDYLAGWNKIYKTNQVERGLVRTETLWMNYEIGQMML